MKKFFYASVAFLAFSSFAYAEEPIRLCSGASNGVYYEAAEEIKRFAGRNLPVINVETVGTGENIELTMQSSDGCDAFIGQPDAVVFESKSAPAIAKKLRPIGTMHREYLHALCSKESGVDDIGDLEGNPTKYSIAIGDHGSGAWYVWQNFITEDDDYSSVPVVNEGGIIALSSVASGQASCMLVPAGLGNGTVNEADMSYSDTVSLVGVNDRDFDDATDIQGKPLYEYRNIDGVYKNLQGFWGDVDTVSWLATVYANPDKITDKKRLTSLVQAVARAGVNMKAKYGK